jgi:hypothetical protein
MATTQIVSIKEVVARLPGVEILFWNRLIDYMLPLGPRSTGKVDLDKVQRALLDLSNTFVAKADRYPIAAVMAERIAKAADGYPPRTKFKLEREHW